MRKVIIVGGGVAGLSAGIYAQRAGYDTIIYEKNNIAGGSCSGWYRNGYAIDNCLHWLTGSKDGTEQNKLWKEIGVLNDSVSIIRRKSFYSSESQGCSVTLWRDVEQTRSEMLELSPEDADEINAFIDSVIFVNDVLNSGMTPKDIIHTFNDGEFELSHFEFARFFMRYLSLNLEEWAAKFKHPALQGLILDFMAKEYESYWLIMAYSFFAFENGDIIDGGSIGIAKNMTNSYLEAGGTLKLNCPVEKLIINKKKTTENHAEHSISGARSIRKATSQHADGVLLTNGRKEYADYIICACDMNYTFNHLLKKRFTPKSLEDIYQNKKNCMIYSSFQVAFSVDGLFEEIDDTLGIECQPFEVAFESYHRMTIKNYRCYGDYIAPPEHTVIQCSLPQYEKDYHFWKKLYQNKALYNNTKRNIAEAIRSRILERFPTYEGRIHLLDSWTPYSYALRNNDYKGAYMRFLTTPFNRNAFLPYEVKGLDNVYLAGHWLRYPGGLPTAVTTGKVVVQRIQDNEESISS